ncbi:hypothetical protein EVAR_9525_1 [Eumeta japonica]|uniref:Uncharacterized protein n=1 Tax=Eumeta variegata TaxID=151549 RepID=A0A4C1U4L3_EUMVA|nr:hypothetical protein EVAR_9525_1 [Eumeta japonica]
MHWQGGVVIEREEMRERKERGRKRKPEGFDVIGRDLIGMGVLSARDCPRVTRNQACRHDHERASARAGPSSGTPGGAPGSLLRL